MLFIIKNKCRVVAIIWVYIKIWAVLLEIDDNHNVIIFSGIVVSFVNLNGLFTSCI